MKDKAEILLQVDESQSIKNELTLQVNISAIYFKKHIKSKYQNNWVGRTMSSVMFMEQDLPTAPSLDGLISVSKN